MRYIWWVNSDIYIGQYHFEKRVMELIGWMNDNERKFKQVFRADPDDETLGMSFSTWRDAVEFKLAFSELIVGGEETDD